MEYREIDDLLRASRANGKHPLVFTKSDWPKVHKFLEVNGYEFDDKQQTSVLGIKVYEATT